MLVLFVAWGMNYQNCGTVTVSSGKGLSGVISNLNATTISTSQVDLIWSNINDAAVSHELEYSTDKNFSSDVSAVNPAPFIKDSKYTVNGLDKSKEYFFRLHTKNVDGTYSDSNIANATTLGDSVVNVNTGNARGVPIDSTNYGPTASLECPNQQSPNSVYVDSNFTGTSIGTFAQPFKTLASINATNTPAGNKVCIKKNSVFRYNTSNTGFFVSGTPGKPVIVTSYGSGAAPKFLGSIAVNGWTLHSGNIYKKTGVGVPSGHTVEFLSINGKFQGKARYPKADAAQPWLYKETNRGDPNNDPTSGSPLNSNGYFVKYLGLGSMLQGLGNPNLAGSQIVIKESNWSMLPLEITSVNTSTNKIFFRHYSEYGMPTPEQILYEFYYFKFGFFLTNHLSYVTQAGDWHYNRATDTLYIHSPSGPPAAGTIEVTSITPGMLDVGNTTAQPGVGFNFFQKHDLIIQNMSFSGYAFAAIVAADVDNLTIQNNEFTNSSRSLRFWDDTGTKFLRNRVSDIFVEGLFTGSSKNLEIGNNFFIAIGDKPGTSYSNWTYFGVNFSSDNSVPSAPYNVHDNTFVDVGYIAINAYGPGNIRNNYIQRPMRMLNDGGGIAFDQNFLNAGSMTIENNIINDCLGNLSGSALPPDYYNYSPLCFGIYYGNRQLNNVKTKNNTVINATISFTIDHSHTALDSSGNGSRGPTRGHEVFGNTFFGFTETGGYHGDYSTYTYPGGPNEPNRSIAPWYFNEQYNDKVYNNIFYAGSDEATMQNTLHVYSNGTKDTTTGLLKKTNFFGTVGAVAGNSNNNSYYSPFGLNPFSKVRCEFSDYNGFNSCGANGHNGFTNITFDQWKTTPSLTNPLGTSQDRSSTYKTGSEAANLKPAEDRGVIYFNNTATSQTFQLENCMVDLNGADAGASLILQPYTSKIFERLEICQ